MSRIILHRHGPTRDDATRWEESKHPRADNGQFGHGAGATVAPGVKVHVHGGELSVEEQRAAAKRREHEFFGKPGKHDWKVKFDSGLGMIVEGDNEEEARIKALNSSNPKAGGIAKIDRTHSDFSASDYAKSQDDPDATAETIMAKLTPEQRAEIEDVHRRIGEAGQTIERHRDPVGNYSKERQAIHDMILFEGRKGRDPETGGEKWYPGILNPDAVRNATPPPGQAPTFTMLGGRGGSGKSAFKGMVYDEDKAIVLDADVIKHMIEEFKGWNANEVHEESSDILETAIRTARELGLNVVLDATMKSSGGAMEKAETFKKAGYRVETHYMHLPRHIAAERAVGRYFSPSKRDPNARGRYVPAHVVLGNRMNEANFDQVRQLADRWSFLDNNVPRGEPPKLVARGGYDD